jgi:O-antigen ligase
MSVASPYSFTSFSNGRSSSRPSTRVSVISGAFLLSLIVFVNESSLRRGSDFSFQFDWQLALKLGISAVCGIYGLIHLRKSSTTLLKGGGVLAVLFGFWAVLTVPFAINTIYCAGACAALWCTILFAAAVKDELQPRFLVLTVLATLMAYLVVSWTVYILAPDLAQEEQMIGNGEIVQRFGGLNHPNTLGRQAALAIAMLLVAGLQQFVRWRHLWIPLLFAGATIVVTDSRTAIVVAAAIVGVAVSQSMRPAVVVTSIFVILPMAATAFAVAAAFGLIDVQIDQVMSGASRSGDSDEIYSLTGRTMVWEFALGEFAKSPWMGCGYGCSRWVMEHNFFPTHSAHNQLINIMLTTGMLGGLLLVAQTFVLAAISIISRDPFPILVLTAVFVGGISENVILGPIPDSHTVLWLLALLWPVSRLRTSTANPSQGEIAA